MTLLLALEYLSEACFISINHNEKKLKMALKIAQDNLKQVLGPEFYEEIETQYASTFTTANDTLYEDYIKNYLAWQTYFYHLKYSQADDTPTGVRQFKEDNSDILSDIKLTSFEKNVGQQANFYKNEMINYLKNEQDKVSTAFPLWVEVCNESFSFGFSSVGGESDATFKINKAVRTNE